MMKRLSVQGNVIFCFSIDSMLLSMLHMICNIYVTYPMLQGTGESLKNRYCSYTCELLFFIRMKTAKHYRFLLLITI